MHDFGAGVRGNDFVEPRLLGDLILRCEDFDDVAVLEFMIQIAHFTIYLNAGDMIADFGMETVGKIKRQGAFGQINDVAFWSVDKNLIGKKVEFELFEIDLLPFAEPGGGGL